MPTTELDFILDHAQYVHRPPNRAHTRKKILQCLPQNVGTYLFNDCTLQFLDLWDFRAVATDMVLKKTG
jgi:hypothetical protein